MVVEIFVARNANDAVVAPVVGSVSFCVWRECGVWSQMISFVRLAGIWLQSP